jgi:hypothetical protein
MKLAYLSICAIFKDEAPYLPEWIEFHDPALLSSASEVRARRAALQDDDGAC